MRKLTLCLSVVILSSCSMDIDLGAPDYGLGIELGGNTSIDTVTNITQNSAEVHITVMPEKTDAKISSFLSKCLIKVILDYTIKIAIITA